MLDSYGHYKSQVGLSTPVAELEFLPSAQRKALQKFGLSTAGLLLMHFPRRYEDRSHFARFPHDELADPVCLQGTVVSVALKRFGRRSTFELVLSEGESTALSAIVTCRWFNMPYLQKQFLKGQRVVVHGRPKRSGKRICMDHPEYEIIESGEENFIHLNRIVPVHPAGEGVSARMLRSAIFHVLKMMTQLPEVLPESMRRTGRLAVLEHIHFPPDIAALGEAREQLVVEEFLRMQLVLGRRRRDRVRMPGTALRAHGQLFATLRSGLGFHLTGAQCRVIDEVCTDLKSASPMNRLLQGDVGSGKTLVALAAMLHAVESGHQAALMAPTQILAEQHYLNFKRMMGDLNVSLALRTGQRKETTAQLPLFGGSSSDEADIVVGTHALLYGENVFTRLGLVVIDEQHKFGVAQRARLIARGQNPHILVMTATPIPRTLTMSFYGDLDVSIIDALPPGRGSVLTRIRDRSRLPGAIDFLRGKFAEGRQAYIVYPLIDESEASASKAAVAEYGEWQKHLAPYRCGLLHGRVPAEEKERVMAQFRAGEIHALIATSVIEVGVDVPNATVMLIENADRFGLAQLHQLRGRVGRGSHQSYCILMVDEDDDEAADKIRILERTRNGFEISDADLELRGAGDLLGTAQSGLPPLRLGDLIRDRALMERVREYVSKVYRVDPDLSKPENERLRHLVVETDDVLFSHIS